MTKTKSQIQDDFSGSVALVVDDEELIRDFLSETLTRRGFETYTCTNGANAQEIMSNQTFDLVITDIRMPVVDGIELLRWIVGNHPTIPVIMLTAFATIESAVDTIKIGAFEYLCKPVTDLKELDRLLAKAMQHRRLLVENQWLRGQITSRYKFDQLVGPGPEMQRIFELLATVAPTQATVLIQGASGTGKELVARAVHFNSLRSNRPFIKVNCAALPEGLIESELFGHEKGAFTGAIRTTRGMIEAANGGTLLLDEIGEMPIGLQAKLLRVLQEKEFQCVGSNETVKVDFRLIATTNIQLEDAVRRADFREDLFYRLNVIPIKMPSLDERRSDIPVLAHHFLHRFAKLHGRKIDGISAEAMRYLLQAPWRGNVRELENSIERAVVMCKSENVELTDFFLNEEPPAIPVSGSEKKTNLAVDENITLAELEKRHILATLQRLDGHRAQTAESLGISIRTLRNKLNEYRLQGVEIR